VLLYATSIIVLCCCWHR